MKKLALAVIIAALAAGANAGSWFDNGGLGGTCQGSSCDTGGSTGGAGGNATVGDIDNRNTNTNLNTAYGGDARSNANAGAAAFNLNDISNRNTVGVGVGVGVHNRVGQDQNQTASARSDQDQNQDQSQSLNNVNDLRNSQSTEQANSQTLIYKESDGVHYSGEYKVKSAPSMGLTTPPSTAPCYVSLGASGSGIGFGFAVNGSVYDKECEVRQTVIIGLSQGNQEVVDAANEVLLTRLNSYREKDEEKAEKAAAAGEAGGASSGVFALTDY